MCVQSNRVCVCVRGEGGGGGGHVLSRHLPARAAHFFFLRLKKQQHLEYTDCLHDDLQSLSGD